MLAVYSAKVLNERIPDCQMTYDTFHTPIPWKSSTAPEGGDTNKVRCQLDKHVATLIRGSARSFQTSVQLHNTPVIRPCVLMEKLSH